MDSEQDALRAELKLATDLAGIGVWRLDLTTRRVLCDPTLQRMLGVEAVIEDGLLPVHPDDRERTSEEINAQADGPTQGGSVRTRVVHPDGKIRHIQTHFRKLPQSSPAHPRGELIGVTRDITDEVEHASRQQMLARPASTWLPPKPRASAAGNWIPRHASLRVDRESAARDLSGRAHDPSLDAYLAPGASGRSSK